MLVDDLPEARGVGIVRHALEHQRGRAVGERTVDDIGVAGDPADIGRAPIDVAVVIVEHILMRHRGEHEIAARGVQHALGLSRRARSVEDEERILRAHLLGRTVVADLGELLVEPEVAARRPRHLAAGAADHEHLLDAAHLLQGLVGIGLERNLAAAAQAFVGRDQEARLAVLDAAGERVRREAAEHHRMDGADARAGEHGVSRFRDHRQVDGDPVAALDAVRLQHIGEAADLLVQLAIGDVLRLCEGSSGSQMMAICLPRFFRCRSMQLAETLRVPSSNHLIETSG